MCQYTDVNFWQHKTGFKQHDILLSNMGCDAHMVMEVLSLKHILTCVCVCVCAWGEGVEQGITAAGTGGGIFLQMVI
jgi:hypothetical protein